MLPLANGSIAHLFVVYGYQGSSDDPHKLALTNKLLDAVICESRACGTGQPVIISGDLNAEPSVSPVAAKVLKCGDLIDLDEAYAGGGGVPPSPTCGFALDGAAGTRRGFFLVWSNALAASTNCEVLTDRWFRPHFSVCAWFSLVAWSAEVQFARIVSPLAPACLLCCPDRSRSSACKAVQDIWEVYLETLRPVPVKIRVDLHKSCYLDPDVDRAWSVWCSAAEVGLLAAYKTAGGPCPQCDPPFFRQGLGGHPI